MDSAVETDVKPPIKVWSTIFVTFGQFLPQIYKNVPKRCLYPEIF